MSLLRRALEPVPRFHRVRDQQGTIPPELSHQAPGVHIAAFRQLFHLRDGIAALLHGQALVPNHIPERPVVVRLVAEFLRLIVLIEILFLEGDLVQPQALRLTDDRIFDLCELFLL